MRIHFEAERYMVKRSHQCIDCHLKKLDSSAFVRLKSVCFFRLPVSTYVRPLARARPSVHPSARLSVRPAAEPYIVRPAQTFSSRLVLRHYRPQD